MGAMPPLPPGMAGTAAPTPQPQSMMQLTGMGGGATPQGMAPPAAPSAGMSQISESAVRMAAEIDQALKLLAQSMPQLAPWVEQTCEQLRFQVGSALNSGAVPTSPTPSDNSRFPDGGGRM